MLSDKEESLFWKYNVPLNVECNIRVAENCPICEGDEYFREWLSRYLISNIPTDVLQQFIEENFGMIVDSAVLTEHRSHIIVKYLTDEEIRKKAAEDFGAIMSDLDSKGIDEKKAMDTSIRMLYAKILQMQKEGETGKEFLMAIHELKTYIEMKLKMKRELPEESNKLDLKDMVRIDVSDRREDDNIKKTDKQ